MACQKEGVIFLQMVLVGSAGVGKSALANRIMNRFPIDTIVKPKNITSYANFSVREIRIRNKDYKLDICDTHGDIEEFHLQYLSASVIVLVFDLTSRKSFHEISRILTRIKEITCTDRKYVIVGNKCDLNLDRLVEPFEVNTFATESNAPYFEICAHSGHNVQQLIECWTEF